MKLKIGGHTWNVEYKEIEDLGKTDWNTLTITISSVVPESIQKSALIHEILHACNSSLGGSEVGHAFLDSIAEQLYQVLSDNDMLK